MLFEMILCSTKRAAPCPTFAPHVGGFFVTSRNFDAHFWRGPTYLSPHLACIPIAPYYGLSPDVPLVLQAPHARVEKAEKLTNAFVHCKLIFFISRIYTGCDGGGEILILFKRGKGGGRRWVLGFWVWSFWEMFGMCLGFAWGVFGVCLGYVWGVFGVSLGRRLGIFWASFGRVLGHVLDVCWACFGRVLDMFCACLGCIWGVCWASFGRFLDMFWTCFGYVLDVFWAYFVRVLYVCAFASFFPSVFLFGR